MRKISLFFLILICVIFIFSEYAEYAYYIEHDGPAFLTNIAKFIRIEAIIFALSILIILFIIIVLSVSTAKKIIKNIEKNKEAMAFRRTINFIEDSKEFSIISFGVGILFFFNIEFIFDIHFHFLFTLICIGFVSLMPLIYIYCLFGEKIIQKFKEIQENKITDIEYFINFLFSESISKTFILLAVSAIELLTIFFTGKLLYVFMYEKI